MLSLFLCGVYPGAGSFVANSLDPNWCLAIRYVGVPAGLSAAAAGRGQQARPNSLCANLTDTRPHFPIVPMITARAVDDVVKMTYNRKRYWQWSGSLQGLRPVCKGRRRGGGGSAAVGHWVELLCPPGPQRFQRKGLARDMTNIGSTIIKLVVRAR